MFECLDCGKTFEEPHEYEEHIGDFWGSPAYEKHIECPYCGGNFDDERMVNEMEEEEEEE